MKCDNETGMDNNYILLMEYFLKFTFDDYKCLCLGKLPSRYPHFQRENKDRYINIEKKKIENMAKNGVCEYLFIDPEDFSSRLQKIRMECYHE